MESFGQITPTSRSLLARSYPWNKIRYLYYRGMIWPKDSLVLGWSGQKTPWCQGWVSTKESFVQITPTPRSLLARSPLKTLKAIFRKSKKHQEVFCPNHCRNRVCNAAPKRVGRENFALNLLLNDPKCTDDRAWSVLHDGLNLQHKKFFNDIS